MYRSSAAYLLLLPSVAQAFAAGWTPSVQSVIARSQADPCVPVRGSVVSLGSDPRRPAWGRARLGKRRAMPNEYEVFFNKASESGVAAIRKLTPEERADRALEGEIIEDEIIELATVLREKADAMVAETGSINFGVIQPMIDQIDVLKNKYKLVVGAVEPEETRNNTGSDDLGEVGEGDGSPE